MSLGGIASAPKPRFGKALAGNSCNKFPFIYFDKEVYLFEMETNIDLDAIR